MIRFPTRVSWSTSRRTSVILLAVFLTAVTATASTVSAGTNEPASLEIETVPRLDLWQGDRAVMRAVYARLAIDSSKNISTSTGSIALRGRAEGFASYDFAEENLRPLGNPDLRKSRDEADLNELWIDATAGSVGLRVGRQPIRWSQSWTLPSLDILTGRRGHRLFMDPLIDQLTHPDAVRLTKSFAIGDQTIETEVVHVLRSAPNGFAQPIPHQDRADNGVTAAKISTRMGSLDMGLIASETVRGTTSGELLGLFGSYAFEDFVAKAEASITSRDSKFAMLGIDWFAGDWMIGPQMTVFRDSLLGIRNGTALAFLPVRYTPAKWSVEFDLLQAFGSPDAIRNRFTSLRVGREIAEALVLSVAVQDYRGDALGVFGQGERLTGGRIYGARLEYTGGWVK